ncbi:MAG: XRE family transcriptional regulator [Clostridia bacterium]|nr:XRE family transcriptional regulator [Clostridia bacterium]
MKDNKIEFGSNLKKIRKKAGISRVKLAEMIAYSEKAIEKWESGSSVPPVTTVCQLAEMFEISVDSLLYAPKTEVKYLLGIDGGGTKTEFLLTDSVKKEIARVKLGPSNPVDIGMENTKKILEQGIRQVCEGINIREVSVFAGLAGGITGDNKEQINSFLSQFNFAFYDNGSDTGNALSIALKGEDGVVVIMGTGIVAFSQVGSTKHRIGGWGYHIDQGGSGYNFGSDALDSALKFIDGRGGSELIKNLIENHLSKPIPDAITDIYQGGKAYVASFARYVFAAFNQGDKEAERIIDKNVCEVAQIIAAGKKYFDDKTVKVVICGGLCNYEQELVPFFKKYLGENQHITFSNEPVVDGAIMLAEKIKNGGNE